MVLRRLLCVAFVAFVLVSAGPPPSVIGLAAADLPSKLSDQDFWKLSESMSEANGHFQSDNLLSNETAFARIVPALIDRTKPGGVYLGVGPEQNFTYIAAMRPRIVFITDVRRGNLQLQLMYKALFELSADRAEFASRLFTKKKPAGLTAGATAFDLMNAFWDVWSDDEAAYQANLKAIDEELTKKHHLPLDDEDLRGIAAVYRAFYWYGPAMSYSANVSLRSIGNGHPTYADLMIQTGDGGRGLSYLASEENFRVLKDLESKNLIVPVVGNFSGPKALRAVGAYVREHGATVSAFYVSNVESYLKRDGIWQTFCANVATMPLDESSVFIRPSGAPAMAIARPVSPGDPAPFTTSTVRSVTKSGLVPMTDEIRNCAMPGGTGR